MKRLAKGKFMMATKAIHKTGDLSSSKPDLCLVHYEDEENYMGRWYTGFGLIGVLFPKNTTTELTNKDVNTWAKRNFYLNSTPLGRLTKDKLRNK